MAPESTSFLLGRLVTQLEREGEQILRVETGISYKRAVFLFVLRFLGTVTQHHLAEALGYSDPAVSMMLRELVKEGFVTTAPDPEHGRKQLVTLTPEGQEIAIRARHVLDAHFDELVQLAEVDDQQLRSITTKLIMAIAEKRKKELS